MDSLEDLEIAVPVDQRPVNELANLKEAFLYNWVGRVIHHTANRSSSALLLLCDTHILAKVVHAPMPGCTSS